MSDPRHLAANALVLGLAVPASVAFHRATRDVAGVQARILRGILARNADSAFGRRQAFAATGSVEAYRARVPLSDYDDYREPIARIAAGEPRVLTAEPVRVLSPTSGSTAGPKLIPYTDGLRAEFQRAVLPWLVDLHRHEPGLLEGPAYWAVTPLAHPDTRTAGGVAIGFEDDTEYLGPLRGWLLRRVQAVPPDVRRLADIETVRYVTLLWLVRQPALALLSVWSPSFLTILLDHLAGWGPRLADDVARGTLSPPAPVPPDLHARLAAGLRADPARAAAVRRACQAATPGERHARLWPRLRLVSCWTEGAAALYVGEVARRLPGVCIQGKGLLATEAVVSIPLVGQPGAALAVRSHFFEFLAEAGEPRLAHELEAGRRYEVVVTTGGGLYRYRLGDVVEVVGHAGGCPLLRFVGRAGAVSDRVGEKLHEAHVREALNRLLARHGIAARFAMLACEGDGVPAVYTLFVEAEESPDDALRRLGADLETALGENFHYRYCRDLGQLAPVGVFRIDGGAAEAFLARQGQRGQRLGAVKPVALAREGGWTRVFRGRPLADHVGSAATRRR